MNCNKKNRSSTGNASYNGKQNTTSSIHSKQFLYKQNLFYLPVLRSPVIAPTQFTLLFYADKVTCNTNKAVQRKTKNLTFSWAGMKFCNSMLRATPPVPTQTFFQAGNQYVFGRKNPFAFPPKDFPLLHVDSLSR